MNFQKCYSTTLLVKKKKTPQVNWFILLKIYEDRIFLI